jgi:hypothetical protein
MDGFTGFKSAAVEELPDVVTVMDPFYVDVVVMPMSSGGGWRGKGIGLVRSA